MQTRTTAKEDRKALRYALITPARNEEAFIELTIKSVIHQTDLPTKWIIVSDGSTDQTDGIVQKYLEEYSWIELVKLADRQERHFAGKVHAFNAGYERLKNIEYDIIGNLDADISFDPEYFEFLLGKFAEFPDLGVAGAPFREGALQYDYRFSRKEHVSGACQLFRKECFEAIGGYAPLKTGGIDLVAVVHARMKGWETQTFTEKYCLHHRKMGSAQHSMITRYVKGGYHDYLMGVHPLWQLLRSIYQLSRKPVIAGGLLLLVGYLWAMLTRANVPVSAEFIEFRRKEQMSWLKDFFRRLF